MRFARVSLVVIMGLLSFVCWGSSVYAAGSYSFVSGPDGGIQKNGWYEYNEQLPTITFKGSGNVACNQGNFTLSLAPSGSGGMGSHVLRYFYAPSDPKGDLWVSMDGNLVGSLCSNDTSYSGSTVTVWQGTVKYDGWPPVVTIASPAPNTTVNAASVTVSGSAYDTGDDNKSECLTLSKCSLLASVQVNGVNATISGDRYSAQVPLKPGINTLTARAMDNADISSPAAVITVLRSESAATTNGSPSDSSNLVKLGVGATVGVGAASTIGYALYKRHR